MKERWRAIKGYEGLYSVSSHGRVLSRARTVPYRDSVRSVPKRFVVAFVDKHGHRVVRLWKNNKETRYRVGRLVYETFKGPLGRLDVDHKNRKRCDDRLTNLRKATRTRNLQNMTKRRNTSSQYKGVCWFARKKTWMASITVNKVVMYLGYFKSEIQAAKAYDRAAQKHFGEFAVLNFKDKK